MRVTIDGKPEEMEKLFNAIAGSKEQLSQIASDTSYLRKRFPPFDKEEQAKLLKKISEDLQE